MDGGNSRYTDTIARGGDDEFVVVTEGVAATDDDEGGDGKAAIAVHRHGLDTQEARAELIAAADDIAGSGSYTGRNKPSVIT